MPDYTLPRAERLRSLKAIRRIFGQGQSGFVYPLRYVWLAEPVVGAEACAEESMDAAERGVKVMFSVPKKFHKRANKRNLLKRRMREVYRLQRSGLCEALQEQGKQISVAFVYSAKECQEYKTIEYAIRRILEQIQARL